MFHNVVKRNIDKILFLQVTGSSDYQENNTFEIPKGKKVIVHQNITLNPVNTSGLFDPIESENNGKFEAEGKNKGIAKVTDIIVTFLL